MSIDPRKIQIQLQKPELPLHIFDTVTSTNQVVWDLLAEGNPFPLMAIASQQTAGRGQWGRNWVSAVGDFIYPSV